MVTIPGRLAARLAEAPDAGQRWLAELPATLAGLAARWGLVLGEPIRPGGVTSVVLPARRRDGSAAMLKVPVLDDEVAGEPTALALVDGDGAARLLAHDPSSGALLLEALDPDRSLLDVADAEQATQRAAALLQRWWRPAPPETRLPRLTELGPALAEELRQRRRWLVTHLGARLIDRAVATLVEPGAVADTLLHGDLHQGNVLAGEREPWLVIDPKPLVGEPAFDLEPLLRDHRPPAVPPSASRLRRRFAATSAQLDLDRDRAREWVIARALVLGSGSLASGDRRGWQQVRVGQVLGGES